MSTANDALRDLVRSRSTNTEPSWQAGPAPAAFLPPLPAGELTDEQFKQFFGRVSFLNPISNKRVQSVNVIAATQKLVADSATNKEYRGFLGMEHDEKGEVVFRAIVCHGRGGNGTSNIATDETTPSLGEAISILNGEINRKAASGKGYEPVSGRVDEFDSMGPLRRDTTSNMFRARTT